MAGKKRRKLRYFYLDGRLHRVLHVNRPQDLVTAWDYPEGRRKMYVWSYVQKNMEYAFTTQQVANMLNRHKRRIDSYLRDGHIRAPQKTYSIDENRTPGKYFFSESDVLECYDYMLTVHRGRPRLDGLVTTSRLPTRKELIAQMRHDSVLYVKDDKGEFIPVWKERF